MARNKRIALVVNSFPTLSETFIVNHFLGLLQKGWDVHILTTTFDKAAWNCYAALYNAPELRRRVHTIWPYRPRWLALLLMPFAITRVLSVNWKGLFRYLKFNLQKDWTKVIWQLYLDANFFVLQPDLIHFEFGTLAIGRTTLGKSLSSKMVSSFRGYDLNFVGLENDLYFRDVWETADSIHLLSEDLWMRAQKRGCPAEMPHVLIPPAIDYQKFSPLHRLFEPIGTIDRPVRILSVGRLEWKKGHEFSLQSIKILKDRGIICKYHIIGSGNSYEAIAFARHQLGLENEVELLGSMPREGVIEALKWADIFIHPSVSEGFCNAVVEAQAMELPVVCTNADGLSQNVDDGVTGFVVPRREPIEMANKIECLVDDMKLREDMGRVGRKRVVEKFNVSNQIEAFDRFYSGLFGGSV